MTLEEIIAKYGLIILIVGIAVLLILILLITILIVKKKKNKKPRIIIDDDFIDSLIALYGGNNNIKEVNVENGRLKITVNDLDIVNLNGIKSYAESGVFVTGDVIKTLYKHDSEVIKKAINKKI